MPGIARRLSMLGALALAAGSFSVVAAPAALAATPSFELPFPCGQSWTGNPTRSSAHTSWEIDFNRGSTPTADLGDTVSAAAAGTVITSGMQPYNPATKKGNGYGNLVVIDHGGGWKTYYAHLKTRAVKVGDRILKGQPIGSVGNTSKKYPGISPHMHYEVRLDNLVQRAVFHGTAYRSPA